MRFRVSNVESFRYWKQDEDSTLDTLLAELSEDSEPTEPMRRGTAFHLAMERAAVGGAVDQIEVDGFVFCFDGDFQVPMSKMREVRAYKDYGGIEITGKVDHISGSIIDDYKTTTRFEPERYIEGYQWRYYLDIFSADRFRWQIFEMREIEDRIYSIHSLHTMEQCRYPAMESDCRNLALELKRFAEANKNTLVGA